MAEERGFEFVDNRKVQPDGPSDAGTISEPDAPPPPQQPQPPEPPSSPEPAAPPEPPTPPDAPQPPTPPEPPGEPNLPPMTAIGVLHTAILLFEEGAWAWLGLRPEPMTGKVKRDLPQARLAIDSIRALAGVLEPQLGSEDRRELQVLLSNLQMNFVQQQGMESKGTD